MRPTPPRDNAAVQPDPNAGRDVTADVKAPPRSALTDPDLLAKTEDVSSAASLGAPGEHTQGARTADTGNPSKA